MTTRLRANTIPSFQGDNNAKHGIKTVEFYTWFLYMSVWNRPNFDGRFAID